MRRRKLGLSQRELATLLRVTTATVARWESGYFFPPTDLMLDKALKCIELEARIGTEEFVRLVSQFTALSDKVSLSEPARRGIERFLKNDEDKIRALVAEHPDATLNELCKLVREAGGAVVSRSTMHLELKRLNISTQRSRGSYFKNRDAALAEW